MGVCPEGTWVAVGFSTGVVSILELHSGLLLSSWKAHDGEILQVGPSSSVHVLIHALVCWIVVVCVCVCCVCM